MNFPPRAFIIGAQKAATTSLAFLLDQHPSIRLSNPKETHFFSVNWEEGEGWYRAKFSNPTDDVLLLDASTSYAMAPIGDNRPDSSKRPRWGQSVPERIHGYAENAKFIYMLRKPADRTYSAYWHNVRSGQEKMPFRDAIEAHPVYLETSKYHAQIAIFLKHFDLKEFYLVDFQDFSGNPGKYATACLEFLELPERDFEFELEVEKNKSFQYNTVGRAVQRMFGSDKSLKSANQLIKGLIPPPLHNRLKSLVSKDIPPMSESDRAYLEEYFADDNRKLRELTGFEFQ